MFDLPGVWPDDELADSQGAAIKILHSAGKPLLALIGT